MTAIQAPGLFGPAPSAANAPPTPAGTPGRAGPFGALLAAVVAASQQGDGETPMPLSGGGTATTDNLGALAGLWAALQGLTGTSATFQETQTTLTPDRIAGAEPGGPSTEGPPIEALEALMAQILVLQQAALQPVAKVIEPVSLVVSAMPVDAAAQGEAVALGGPESGTVRTVAAIQAAVASAPALAAAASKPGSTTEDGQATPVALAQPASLEARRMAAPPTVASVAQQATPLAEPGSRPVMDLAAVQAAVEATDGEAGPGAPAIQPVAQTRRAEPSRVDVQAAAPAVEPSANAPDGIEATQRADAPRAVDMAVVTSRVADTVVRATLSGQREMRLVLNPPELGVLHIRVTVTSSGLHIQLDASVAGTRDALQQQLPALHQALEARDLRVDRVDVRQADQSSGAHSQHAGSGSHGSPQGGSQQRGSERPDWSPVAWLAGGPGGTQSSTANPLVTASADGRLNVLA